MASSPVTPWVVSRCSSSWNASVAWFGSAADRSTIGASVADGCNTTSKRCDGWGGCTTDSLARYLLAWPPRAHRGGHGLAAPNMTKRTQYVGPDGRRGVRVPRLPDRHAPTSQRRQAVGCRGADR